MQLLQRLLPVHIFPLPYLFARLLYSHKSWHKVLTFPLIKDTSHIKTQESLQWPPSSPPTHIFSSLTSWSACSISISWTSYSASVRSSLSSIFISSDLCSSKNLSNSVRVENILGCTLNLYNSHIKVRRMIMKSVSNFVQTLKNLIKMFKLSLHTNLCIQIKNPHFYWNL